MTVPRVVLDTNVVLSSLLFRSASLSWLRLAWQSEGVRPLVSRATIDELIRALAYPKFRLAPDERAELLADHLPWCETVKVPATLATPAVRDPGDRPFLVLAAAARADALVTGDKDVLALTGAFAVPILTPAALRARLNTSS